MGIPSLRSEPQGFPEGTRYVFHRHPSLASNLPTQAEGVAFRGMGTVQRQFPAAAFHNLFQALFKAIKCQPLACQD